MTWVPSFPDLREGRCQSNQEEAAGTVDNIAQVMNLVLLKHVK